MACLVADGAKCAAAVGRGARAGRGAHRARGRQSGPARPDCKNQCKVSVFSSQMASLVAYSVVSYVVGGRNASTWPVSSSTMRNARREWGRGAHPARTSA
eukprot:8909282-Pyramimonas_sp.AAC.1